MMVHFGDLNFVFGARLAVIHDEAIWVAGLLEVVILAKLKARHAMHREAIETAFGAQGS